MPRIDYTFGDAKNEVLANVNDFDGDVYRVRAKELMFEGINMLVYGNDYLQEDIPGMIMRVPISLNDLSARGAFQWSSPLNTSSSEDNTDTLFNGQVLKILNITPNFDTGTDNKYTYHKIDDMYLNKMKTDSQYQPMSDEIFYHINRITYPYGYGSPEMAETPDNFNVYVKFYPTNIVSDGDGFIFSYIRSPNPNSWKDSTIMAGYFSMPFIYKVVNYATDAIRKLQAGE